jgi:hypothetical protein
MHRMVHDDTDKMLALPQHAPLSYIHRDYRDGAAGVTELGACCTLRSIL